MSLAVSERLDAHGGGVRTYPLIDSDPHFNRVVRYFRAKDYGTIVGTTAAVPAALIIWNRIDPGSYGSGNKRLYGLALTVGFVGGFLLAYQNSSKRFWGWTENARERAKDQAELSARAAAGKPLYGFSAQPENMLQVAASNSRWSQLKFAAMPWFNLVNHSYHGVDPKKYGEEKKDS